VVVALTAIFALAVLYFVYNKLDIQSNTKTTSKTTSEMAAFLEPPVIINGDFEQGALGWNNSYAVQEEDGGNHCIMNNASWEIKQEMNLLPHTTYQINMQTKRGTAEGPARVVFTFRDVNGNKLPQYYDIRHTHTGTGWEDIPQQYIVIPEKAAVTKMYLLTDDLKGYHYFDNIKITRTSDIGDREGLSADPSELLTNGDFELGLFGWVGNASAIIEEENNNLLRNGYNWSLYQQLEVEPEQAYLISAKTRTPNSEVATRIKVVFLNEQGQRIPEFYNIVSNPSKDVWGQVTEVIKIPDGVNQARIYLLANDDSSSVVCDFDDISMKLATDADLQDLAQVQTEDAPSYLDSQTEYIVKTGDTALAIADQFGVSLDELIDANSITDPNNLEVGQILYIP